MLRPRIIVSLLLENEGLVKTKKFKDPRYIGDPINTVKIFNEKKVDELCIFDIGATTQKYEPNYDLIAKIAAQSGMPICYGGGIKSAEQAQKIFNLGIEKIAVSSVIFTEPDIIESIAEKVGVQSVVAVLDIKKKMFGGYEIYINNGKKVITEDVFSLVSRLEKKGVGEIIINNIDLDGTGKGYDFSLIEKITEKLAIPVTVVGGAGSLNDIKKLIEHFGIIGAAAGSLFVFKGKYNAVLINYPDHELKNTLY
ncbi:AglZ/HisF2 family acetamidino modification protein [Chryseobacterium fluminis]|uniref:AglZ/HisF2 family acetamidino modification protein n=1 Tax=Chryseobacterium fluminis TaxID=2983606 RepID=UPI0022587445|nr:AglZ/HisF2 family acetamidino modification protein [Chryseobacterium sp. MMS21-Ot14]UZT99698.1 AglZ/HisF2 family acetamidino modification protein [Chryseobacterium sp. MMS21-Ot14]